ncbi:AsmA family protein [Stappia sp. GBMRC 2046]|uniref:AsmA family protein n=1 Tax=Stappia sediminis TaxID=2692190 RepID=A0A7X3LRQ4_9HYPH|nr:AsmA family protein [Stappia sediminis]MXN63858.1 AsmA family protein [Stappia sediminis]
MWRRVLKRVAFAIAVVVLAGAALIAMILYAPFADNLRAAVLSEVLSVSLEREVVIEGEAKIAINDDLDIVARDLKIARRLFAEGEQPWHTLAEAHAKIPLSSIVEGSFALSGLELTGATVYLLGEAGEDIEGAETWSFAEMAYLPSYVLNDPLSENLVLQDFRLFHPDTGNGWETDIRITELSLKASKGRGKIELEIDGSANGVPLKAGGEFPNPRGPDFNGQANPFAVVASLKGLHFLLDGKMDVSDPIASISAELDLFLNPLGDFLELIELERVVEGGVDAKALLDGPLDALMATDIQTSLYLDSGDEAVVTGEIRDLVQGTGIDLVFDVELATEETAAKAQSLYKIVFTGFRGRTQGTADHLLVRDFVLETNAASAELTEVGPVWVEDIVRDENGRLGLKGIRLIDGEESAPILDLRGQILDALQLQDVEFSGKINLLLADILEGEVEGPEEDLGRLKGEIRLSDADGSLNLDELEASISGTDLITLEIRKEEVTDENGTHPALALEVDVPDFDAIEARFNEPPAKVKNVAFSGRVILREDGLGVSGNATVGQTSAEGNLDLADEDGVPVVTGNVKTGTLHLSDIRKSIEVLDFLDVKEEADLDLSAQLIEQMKVFLSVSVPAIAGAGKAASGLSAKIAYADRLITLDPFKMTYLGGSVATKARIDVGKSPVSLALNGRIDKLRMGTILKELGVPGIVTGTLNVSYDLTGVGSGADQFISSMSGKAAASIWSGTVGTRLIDLAGQSLVRWMFGNKADGDTAKLVCAVIPLNLKGGRGSAKTIVIETENVQIAGGGPIDFRNNTLDLSFLPRAKRPEVVEMVTTFAVRGRISNPEIVVLSGGGGGRVVGEIVTAPFNILGLIFSGGEEAKKAQEKKHKPCVLRKWTGPK